MAAARNKQKYGATAADVNSRSPIRENTILAMIYPPMACHHAPVTLFPAIAPHPAGPEARIQLGLALPDRQHIAQQAAFSRVSTFGTVA